MRLPKEDFPKEMYNILIKYSEKKNGRNILTQKIIWKDGLGYSEQIEWSKITNLIYTIVDGDCNLPSWSKNAILDRDHGYFKFNTHKINTGDDEVFEVVENFST
ncbi:MAG TPA: hypothetical protein PKD85_04670 [Saprospiraceae bacterium]|nr:hypothetical protein [Saprospiraceae bacterium]